MRFIHRLLLSVAVVAVASGPLLSSAPRAGDVEGLDGLIYRGTVTIELNGIGSEHTTVVEKALTSKLDYEERKNARVVIHACGEIDNIHIVKVEHSYSHNCTRETTREKHSEQCLDERARPSRTVSPGDSFVNIENRTGHLHEERSKGATSSFTLLPTVPPADLGSPCRSGTYFMTAASELYYVPESTFKTIERNACSGETKTSSMDITSIDGPTEDQTHLVTSPDGSSIMALMPPVVLPLAVGTHVTVTSYGFEGSTKADAEGKDKEEAGSGKNKNEYSEEMTATWHFTAKTPCEEVQAQLCETLAYLEAYADQEIVRNAKDRDAYETAVNKKAFYICYEGGSAGDGSTSDVDVKPEAEIGVGKDCKLHPEEEEFREDAKRNCMPQPIADAILAHEKQHVAQCKDKERYSDFISRTPAIMSEFEGEGYAAEAAVLLDWAEKNCPNYDVRAGRARLQKASQ